MKNLWVPPIVAVVLALSQVSCIKLDAVASYSVASSKTMENRALIEDIPATVERRNSYRDGGERALSDARANAKRLEKVQSTYNKYFLALGALSKKDLTEYKAQFAGFEKSLSGTGLVTKSEGTAIRKALQGLTTLGADYYRQRELKKIVEAVDPTLQRGMRQMKELNGNYRMSLGREDAASQSALDESLAAGSAQTPPLTPYVPRAIRAQQVTIIKTAQRKSEAFDKAASAIASGHSLLLRDSKNIRGDEAFEALKPQVQEIVDAYEELTK